MSKLYIVATPIGNLEDITLRAIRILKEVGLVLCEDTRVTKKLFNHYEISTPVHSFNSHATDAKFEKILEKLSEGVDMALVSDAGTPTISDPGSKLVEVVRENLPETEIIAVPGASALTSAISVSGIPASEFLFLGFLPHKKGRETLFKEIAESKRPTIFYESPHRILKALQSLEKFVPKRQIIIARELTKIFENTQHGTATKLLEFYEKHPDQVKGEFVVIVAVE